MSHQWINYFPYEKSRNEQTAAINFALDNFIEGDKRYVIVEAGTGVGKSAIGFTIAQYMVDNAVDNDYTSAAYYLTTQKLLQAQYMKDFKKKGMLSLQSSSNYRCQYYKTKTCQEARRELKASKDQRFRSCCAGGCHYVTDKTAFIDGYHGVTNFPYFLNEVNLSGNLPPRKVMVVDECHNIELEMSKFVEVSVTEYFAKKMLKLKKADLTTQFKVISWIKKDYFPKLSAVRNQMAKTLETVGLKNRLAEFVSLEKKWSMIDSHWSKLDRFLSLYSKDNWVMNILDTPRGNKFEFKPIDIAPFTEEFLFKRAEKIFMMSATVMDREAFCRVLGIPEEHTAFISIPSPFSADNRPIYAHPIAKMGARDIDQGLPVLAKAVAAILEQHSTEKGIIHCHSYKIANYLKDNIQSKRLLSHDSSDRDRVLAYHRTDPRPTVLLSPSMSEGVDLKGDTSRFQIICKIPYPYLGDKLVKKRMHKWKWWYPLQTAKTIVQSVGRSIRNEEDHAVTYILDAGWDYFFSKNKHVFPQDFKNCLK
jgi:ATP-dependent DNA helicase DinG